MGQTINTNINAMTAIKFLEISQGELNQSMQRLSSGQKINQAADDAAGLAIAMTIEKQINSYNVALRNANDAQSFLQVGEGTLESIHEILMRMKELALQSANGSNSDRERSNLNAEYENLLKEIDRQADTAEFNGKKLLLGTSFSVEKARYDFQVDTSGNLYNITIDLHRSKADNLGIDVDSDFKVDQSGLILNGPFTSSTSIGLSTTAAGVTTPVTTGNFTFTVGTTTFTADISLVNTVGELIDLINDQSATTSISAEINDEGDLVLYNNNETVTSIALVTPASGTLTLNSATPVTFLSNLAGSVTTQSVPINQSLKNTDIATQSHAVSVLERIDGAINMISTQRAVIGASERRLENSINNMRSIILNLTASKSRIMDADYAEETANLSKFKIMQSAGMQVLGMANQLPQNVLALLQN